MSGEYDYLKAFGFNSREELRVAAAAKRQELIQATLEKLRKAKEEYRTRPKSSRFPALLNTRHEASDSDESNKDSEAEGNEDGKVDENTDNEIIPDESTESEDTDSESDVKENEECEADEDDLASIDDSGDSEELDRCSDQSHEPSSGASVAAPQATTTQP